ncbi:MAG: hypothetical protein KDD39_03840 [Bdellovibrionales bacterium]|nr:hypothetical protein [Bdellovibrionales bacterium]
MKSTETKKDSGSNGSVAFNAEKLSEALKILEEAAADQKEEVRALVTDKFKNLRETFESVEPELKRVGNTVVAFANKMGQAGSDEVKEVAKKVNTDAHNRPWPYIGVAALAGCIFGYLVARK